MKTILIPIFRNILILLLALLAIWYAFYRKISAAEMLATEATLGAIYFLLSCYEFMNAGFALNCPHIVSCTLQMALLRSIF